MNILIIGTGYVGTTTGLFLEREVTEQKLKSLHSGMLHFYEPGLDELLIKHVQQNNITFTNDDDRAIKENDVIYICVGTPQ